MRTERPPDSTGVGLQELPQGNEDQQGRTAVTLLLTDEEMAALQAQAEAEHRPAEDVAADAVGEYTARHAHRVLVQAAIERVVERYAEALRGLGQR